VHHTWQQQNVKEGGVIGHIHHCFLYRGQVLHPIHCGTSKKQQIGDFKRQPCPNVDQPVQRATSLFTTSHDTKREKTSYYQAYNKRKQRKCTFVSPVKSAIAVSMNSEGSNNTEVSNKERAYAVPHRFSTTLFNLRWGPKLIGTLKLRFGGAFVSVFSTEPILVMCASADGEARAATSAAGSKRKSVCKDAHILRVEHSLFLYRDSTIFIGGLIDVTLNATETE